MLQKIRELQGLEALAEQVRAVRRGQARGPCRGDKEQPARTVDNVKASIDREQ